MVPKLKIGAQLYTVRESMITADGFHDGLKRIADMGYTGVQVSAVAAFQSEVSPQQLRRWLDDLHLECCATHRPWDQLLHRTADEVAIHREIGCPYIGIGMAPKECYEGDLSSWMPFIQALPRLLDQLDEAGIDFGFHNHAIEFQIQGEKRGYDLLINDADQRLQLLLDTYWVVHAGVDLVSMIENLHGRLKVVHVKDKSVVKFETRYAPVGEGNLNWSSILPALYRTGTEWVVVEQDDCYGEDPYECLRRSYNNLNALLAKN